MQKFFLLVDDDVDDADLFAEALAGVDASVRFQHIDTVRKLFEFLQMPEQTLPDLLFLDINMPVLSGWQCLTRLRNQGRTEKLPVIMYSTSSYERDRNIARDLGANGFITKPSDFKFLKMVLGRLVACRPESLEQTLKEIHLQQT